MKIFNYSRIIILLLGLFLFNQAKAALTVTKATGGTGMCVGGGYVTLGNLVLSEGASSDLANGQAGGAYQFDISCPANFEFNTSAVITASSTKDITVTGYSYPSTTLLRINVTFDGAHNNPSETFTISGIQVRATTTATTGTLRKAFSSTLTTNGVTNFTNLGDLSSVDGVTKTWVSGATWSTATWSPAGTPTSCDDVVLPAGCNLTNTSATTINNLTIEDGATLTASSAITIGGTFTINSGGTYNHNNTTAASTTIFAGTESFDANSNIVVNSWSSALVPFAGSITGDIGNLTLNYAQVWGQDGEFSNHTIQGNLVVSAGSINFDDANASTSLTIGGDVTFSGTGTHSIYSGNSVPASYTINTGSITVGANAKMYMFPSAGSSGQSIAITMNTSGDWNLSGDFYVATSCLNTPTCSNSVEYDVTCNITGDLNVTMTGAANNFDIVYLAVGDCDVDMNVTGDINCTSIDGWFHFVDLSATTGDVTIDCDNMVIADGADNDFRKGSGNIAITCSGDFTHSGATTVTHFADGTSANGTCTFSANSVTMNDGDFYGNYNGDGAVTYTVTNDVNMLGGSMFLAYTNYAALHTLSVGGVFNQDDGDFRMFYDALSTTSNGRFDIDMGSMDFDGGLFMGCYGTHNGGNTNTFTVVGDVNVNFTDAGDIVRMGTGVSSASSVALLDLDIGGNLTISGLNGEFTTHVGTGAEDIDIVGNVTISNGTNTINGALAAALTCDHNVTLDIGGNLTVSGGTTSFSKESGTLNAGAGNMIDGNVTISGGTLDFKHDDGAATVLVGGNYSQTNGTLYFHNESTNSTADVVATTITGTFSQTGGTLNFDNNTTSTSTHTLTLNGSAITVGGTGSITHANAGTGTVFGEIYVNPSSGSTTYSRTATTHQISQARIIINSSKTMDASGSTQDIQIAGNNAADDVIPPTTIMLDIRGVLNAGTKVIFGRSSTATQRPTSVYVKSGGELQTANTNGMYNGTTSATLAHFTRNSSNTNNTINSMNWFLDANSRVTYNGTSNQVVTGKYPTNLTGSTNSDIALATNAGYHYGYLEVDHQGTIGTNYVYPTASNVFVRTQLDMDRGEFRLDGSGTGYTLNIENSATTGIIVTGANGDAYIRSETSLATNPSIVRWYMGTTTGAHVIPFGHSAGSSNYVPFTFDVNSGGGAGSYVDVSTRATDDGSTANNKDNLPWESTVTNMFDNTLNQDGATEAVIDRWWQIDVSTAYDADITFTYRGAENTLDAPYSTGNVGAQRWDGTQWMPDNANYGSAPAVTTGVGTVTVTGVTAFSPWVLSSLNAPLPVSLILFDAECKDEHTVLNWSTASEQNNKEFTIYASQNGDDYEPVGTVQGYGNSSQQIDYSFVDQNRGDAFYKLIQTDMNGEVDVLSTIKSTCETKGDVSVYPNPSQGEPLTVLFNTNFGNNVTIELFDASGRLVDVKSYNLDGDGMSVIVDTESLQRGVYLMAIRSDYKHVNKKIIVE